MSELASLKAGDEVAVKVGMSESYSILTVKEITGRGTIILQNGNKYRSDGTSMEKGSKWYSPSKIEPVTDDIRQSIRQRQLASAINALDINEWKTFELETLEHIYTQIQLARNKQKH